MFRAILFCMFVAGGTAIALEPTQQEALASLPNVSFHAPNWVASGELTAEDVTLLAANGIRNVIDLSDASETPDFDEAAAVEAAGMRYSNLPIHGATDLDDENVRALDALMTESGSEPTLIHCASSNRVGALIALRAAKLQGASDEVALQTGKDWGLKKLEPAVREQLAQGGPQAASKPTAELQFPRISTAGGVYAMPVGVDFPAKNVIHRMVIDATTDETTPAGTNRHLEAAARAVNLYALAGVPAENVRVAVVMHGKAAPLALSDASYQRLLGSPHPDTGIIAELHKAGVELFVCGQSIAHRGYAPEDVRKEVTLALSAMTKLEELQATGYAIIP